MQVLLARGGAGKTLAVQERLLAVKRRQPLARVWVLLSTERQIVDFRRRLLAQGPTVLFNVETFNFYSLYHHLLAGAGTPQRCLDETARYALIRVLLAAHYAERPGVFGGIAQTPGFVRIVADFITELKQHRVLPETFSQAAGTAKESELGAIYARYQQVLRAHDLVDREGEGWLALEAVERQPTLVAGVDLLIVDGYDQFNPLQADLLAVLGAAVGASVTTLTTVPGREATVGRRFAEALERLRQAHAARSLPFTVEPLEPTEAADERPPALRHLTEQLLRPQPPQIAAGDALQWIEAPDPTQEVSLVLRQVKRRLLAGCPPDDILIALRDWSLYGEQVAVQGVTYGLPLALHHGAPLASSPVVVALLELLRLRAGDFRRRDLFDALRSPYFAVPGLDAGRVALLERVGLELRVTGGRAAWLDAIDLAARPAADEEGQSAWSLDAVLAAELRAALDDFFEAVTPPPVGSVAAYIDWLEALIGQDSPDPDEDHSEQPPIGYTLRLPERIRAGDAAAAARDLAAMQGFKTMLRGLLAAQTLTGSLGYDEQTDWPTFFRDLTTTVAGTSVARGAARDGRVLVTTVTDARGLPQRHVFILGLSEGLFPQPVPEDPLLLDSERLRLRAAGIPLPTQAERAGDDGLFYSLIGQARESLTLARPHSKNGEPWAESHLWRAAWALFSDHAHRRLRLGAVADDPATPAEAALLCADRLSRGLPPSWVEPAAWARIVRARAVEQRRESNAPHDHYSGRLRDPVLIAWAADYLDERHVWSASQLNDYGLCGFRYFAGRLLWLEPLEEPEAGLDPLQRGTLYHEILELTYRRLGGAIVPERLDEALAVLQTVADEQLATAPARLRFRASSQWPQEQIVLRRRLEKLIRDDFGGASPLEKLLPGGREIYRQEAHFDDADGFTIDLGDGERLRVRGSIDRIDRQGKRVVVVDYKSGSTRYDKKEVERGRNFQMLVYLEAAQTVIARDVAPDAPREVVGGLFWQIGRAALGDLSSDDVEVIAAGKGHLARYLTLARAGDFAAHANRLDAGKCASYCDFHQLCRQNVMHKRKP